MSLLSNCTSGGCGAKIGPGELKSILDKLPLLPNDNLIVGYDSSDDAAVYLISEDKAIISTVDFFTPMIDDPYMFGKIAAANALSDVYAMGGDVLFALNLVCFPQKMDKEILGEILRGGSEKIAEAGAVLSGGHSIYDHEPKYGLAVTGIAHPKDVLRNNTCKDGDRLILTKPLGIGLVTSAGRVGEASDEEVAAATATMERLNKYAGEKMKKYQVNACTDITGFGLLAHAVEMAGDEHSLLIDTAALPILPGAMRAAENFLATAAGQRNRNHIGDSVDISGVDPAMQEILFDPQTSGGLLISVAEKDMFALLEDIQKDDPTAEIIGQVFPRTKEMNFPIHLVESTIIDDDGVIVTGIIS